ncbi:DUF4157 domain-containing protein [Ruminiclostridium herbifermentans]|uniref:DUF4157 domain-containing protein n=2 Tax=Ruminiclostridium herbifermentans TaxID=2488810 RepID=A0A4U7JM67_9FIRM|nr:DUF4157 domain-containing protein [Ruminiclostridium herbifermentans]
MRKVPSIKSVQHAAKASNTLLAESNSVQFKKNTEGKLPMNSFNDEILQRKAKLGEEDSPVRETLEPVNKKINNTGMPDRLMEGIEKLSGMDMSDVRVHYNSDKPAQVGALAYTQGRDIHVAAGQEKYLPHEAWHVVQQAQGRVQPTMQMQGIKVNDNPGLEYEADVMGAKAQNYTGNEE